MKNVLDEPKVENNAEGGASRATSCCGYDVQEVAKQIEKGVRDAKVFVSEKLEDVEIAAERLLKRGRYTVEDGIGETAHKIKQYPFSSVAIGFAAGAVLGLLVTRYARK